MLLNLSLTHLFKSIKRNPFYFVHLPLIIYWCFLFIMTTIPVETIPKIFDTQDKFEHFIAYFILSVLMTLSFSLQTRFHIIRRNAVLVSISAIIVYASFDEIHQLLIPGRYCDIYDWLFDIVGGISGILIISYYLKRQDPVTKK